MKDGGGKIEGERWKRKIWREEGPGEGRIEECV